MYWVSLLWLIQGVKMAVATFLKAESFFDGLFPGSRISGKKWDDPIIEVPIKELGPVKDGA